MKYIFLSFVIFSTNIFSDDIFPTKKGEIYYEEVINFEAISKPEIYQSVKGFLKSPNIRFRDISAEKGGWVTAQTNNISNIASSYRTIDTFYEKEEERMTLTITQFYSGHSLMTPQTLFITSKLRIDFKGDKLRYILSDFSYDHYNSSTGRKSQLGYLAKNCNDTNLAILQNCKKKVVRKALNIIKTDVDEFIDELKDSIHLKDNIDDW